jgi:hypothetical protein
MGPRSLLLAVLAGAVGVASALPAERWVRVRSPHAEVLSDAGEESAHAAARRLERLHGVLEPLLPPARELDEGPIGVLVFGDRHAFEDLVPPGRPGGGEVEGFFQGGTERAYMVLHVPPPSSGEGRTWATLDHEYAHLQLNRSLVAQPLWVSEGLAEVLSGGDLDGAEARLGAEAVAALEKALARAPDLAEAAEMLARLAPEPLSRRIALLERSFTRDPARPDLAVVLAALHAKRHDLAATRAVLRRGREAARDPAYRFLCDHLLSQVEGWVAVTGEARGRLVALDCRADGSLRFTLAVGRGTLVLEAPSARGFFVDGPDDLRELELVCGRQDLPVRVRYLPASESASGGTLLTLRVLAAGAP